MKTLRILTCFLIPFLFLSSCGDDDDDGGDGDCGSKGSLTFTLDGSSWSAASFNNTLLIATVSGQGAKRLDIRAIKADGTQLVITTNDLSTGTVGDGVNPNATYTSIDDISTGTENTFFMTMYAANGTTQTVLATDGTLDITACNESNHTVSGTFTFTGEDNSFNDVIGTSGTFTNVCYTVLR